jgi:hypothetical protein
MESPDLLLIPTTSKSIIVCKNFLKKSKTLKKALVLQELFGLNEHSKWKKTDMMLDEKGNITLLDELNISSFDWTALIKFIRINDAASITTEQIVSLNLFTEDEMESIYYTSIKLGGIESIDNFYISYNKFEEKISEDMKKNYNPQEPMEDYKNMYLWTLVNDTNPMTSEIRRLLDMGYSCTSKTFRGGVDQLWYMRREKTATA